MYGDHYVLGQLKQPPLLLPVGAAVYRQFDV